MILGTRLSVKIVFTALKLKDNRPWRERNYALQFLRLEPGLASHVPDLPPELTFIYFGFFRNDAAHCLVGNEGDEKTENHDEALTAALLAGVSSAALAQNSQHATTGTQNNTAGLRQEMTANLQQAGFTNVKVMPDSFLVQATDKSGNPVTMFITPTSMTGVTTTGASTQPSSDNQSGGTFTSIPAKDD